MQGKRTLFLYYDPHYFHAALAAAIGATRHPAPKIRSFETSPLKLLYGMGSSAKAVLLLPKGYDTYFCEGTYLFPAMARRMGLLGKQSKIINLVSSPLLYYMKTGKVTGKKLSLSIDLLDEVDGFVCVGEMERQLLKGFKPNAKTILTYPFIRKEVKGAIMSAGIAKLQSKKILFVGNRDTYYKGLDLLVAAFRKARAQIPQLELTILGDYDRDVIGDLKEGIHTPGYVKNTANFIKEASLYVHLGRGEAFGVAIMEAMLGGVPVIVSNATGAKELVERIDKRMVVPLDSTKAADAIVRYFKMDIAAKLSLAQKGTAMVKKYEEKKIIAKFKKDYARLLTEVSE